MTTPSPEDPPVSERALRSRRGVQPRAAHAPTPGRHRDPAARWRATRLELLLVKRNPAARFMGGVWVFPGGAVEQAEGEDDRAHRAAAVRELREEAGVELPDTAELVKFSRWITPGGGSDALRHPLLPRLASPRPGAARGRRGVRGARLVHARRRARRAHRAARSCWCSPRSSTSSSSPPFATAAELLEHARGRTVEPVQPHVVLDGEVARVLLPGEPGY